MKEWDRSRNHDAWLAELETRLTTLEREMERVRTRLHDFPPQLAAVIQDEFAGIRELLAASPKDPGAEGENRHLRKWDAAIFAAGIIATVAFLKLVKLL